jgi:hypothetical protein
LSDAVTPASGVEGIPNEVVAIGEHFANSTAHSFVCEFHCALRNGSAAMFASAATVLNETAAHCVTPALPAGVCAVTVSDNGRAADGAANFTVAVAGTPVGSY